MDFEEILEGKNHVIYCFIDLPSQAWVSWNKWEILLMQVASVLKAESSVGGGT